MFLVGLLALLAAQPQIVPALSCSTDATSRTELGQRFDLAEDVSANTLLSSDGALYLRARLRLKDAATGGWILTVRDERRRPIQFLTSKSFGTPAGDLWTSRILGASAILSLEAAGEAPQIELREKMVVGKSVKKAYFSIIGDKDIADLYASEDLGDRRLGDAVGLLVLSWDSRSWCCSGVMIAQDLLLTNWHCGGIRPDPKTGFAGMDDKFYWGDLVWKDALIDLSWDGFGDHREYLVDDLVAKSQERDFALLRVRPANGPPGVRVPVLSGRVPSSGDPLRLVHHPACDTKKLSIGAFGGALGELRIAHTCDSEGGSSGGPLFNQTGELVALHHHGVDVDLQTCARTDQVNKAITTKAILDYLSVCRPSVMSSIRTVDYNPPAQSDGRICDR